MKLIKKILSSRCKKGNETFISHCDSGHFPLNIFEVMITIQRLIFSTMGNRPTYYLSNITNKVIISKDNIPYSSL